MLEADDEAVAAGEFCFVVSSLESSMMESEAH